MCRQKSNALTLDDRALHPAQTTTEGLRILIAMNLQRLTEQPLDSELMQDDKHQHVCYLLLQT